MLISRITYLEERIKLMIEHKPVYGANFDIQTYFTVNLQTH